MTRKDFLKACGLLGIGLPLQPLLSSCEKNPLTPDSKVIVIGAGAAGLSAGYLLQQQNINFEILEASSTFGGRTKTNFDFADFPIPLGAEWLHTDTGVFTELLSDGSASVNTVPYDESVDYGLWDGEQITVAEAGFDTDRKFVGATWFTFFRDFVEPSITDKISYNKVVQSIDYSGDKIIVETASEQYEADKVIFTAPVKILQVGDITFTPELPNRKQNAIDDVVIWDGFKAFIEFSEKFYPTFVGFTDGIAETDGQKMYYDAAYGQNTNKHILGLFSVGTQAEQLAALSDSELKDFILAELDGSFNGEASAKYVKHTSQTWNAETEPFAKGAYIYDHENWLNIRRLADCVDNKIYFAGDGYGTANDWSSVHVAIRSAVSAVEELVG